MTGDVKVIVVVLFIAAAYASIVLAPALETAADAQNNTSSVQVFAGQGNGTLNQTSASTSNSIICPSGSVGYRFVLSLPIPFVGDVVLASFDLCPPEGYNGDFLSGAIQQLILIVAFTAVAAGLALIAGYVSSGASPAVLATLSFVLIWGTLIVTLLASIAWFILLLPLGDVLFAVLALFVAATVGLRAKSILAGKV